MSKAHLITRGIGIDMGHRVTHHGSKCRSLHGHRYQIEATCAGPLFEVGQQQGMVLDFGFLKDEMIRSIDALCDHGTALWIDDALVPLVYPEINLDNAKQQIATQGYAFYEQGFCEAGKVVILPVVPTAENLACWWYDLLSPLIKSRSENKATLHSIRVWETPNCSATYPA